uniref:Uncharacterized protein n=1 Tax=Romanomermis culicivorax TaxID=13658 RepID=A0A915JGC6_ROMCU
MRLPEPQKVLHSRTLCGSVNRTKPQCGCGLLPAKSLTFLPVAAKDITVHEFCNVTNTEDLSIEFAKQHNLILAADNIRQQHQRDGFCLMGTPNCNGELRETTVYNARRHKNYDVMRCSGCTRLVPKMQ